MTDVASHCREGLSAAKSPLASAVTTLRSGCRWGGWLWCWPVLCLPPGWDSWTIPIGPCPVSRKKACRGRIGSAPINSAGTCSPARCGAVGCRCPSLVRRWASGVVVGGLLGVVAGYFGKWTDVAISGVVNIALALPALVFALFIVTVLGQSYIKRHHRRDHPVDPGHLLALPGLRRCGSRLGSSLPWPT